jgi:lipopolysaccharide export system permease protein
VAHVPGGQAIGALETASSKLGKALRKLFRRRQPQPAAVLEAAPAE